MKPRGIRNNNPLNIRRAKVPWTGQATWAEVAATGEKWDKEFVQFTSPMWGLRAAFKLLRKYIHNYKLTTVEGIINRWAPPSENSTQHYVHRVLVQRHDKMDVVDTKADLRSLVQAMVLVENGTFVDYPDDVWDEAWERAGGGE